MNVLNHLQIIYSKAGALKIIDLNSTNGTYLNGIKITSGKEYKLKERDEIKLAGVSGIVITIDKPKTGEKTLDTQTNIISHY